MFEGAKRVSLMTPSCGFASTVAVLLPQMASEAALRATILGKNITTLGHEGEAIMSHVMSQKF